MPRTEAVNARMSLVNASRLLLSCGLKLQAKKETVASAAVYFHKFNKIQGSSTHYDPIIVSATCLYLAGKVEEEHLRLRDIINVYYNTLNPGRPPLDLTESYWTLRDSIVKCELILLRFLKFQVANPHPHKVMLQYLKSINVGLDRERQLSFARTAWSILCDWYTNPKCFEFEPRELTISILRLALRLHMIDNAGGVLGLNEGVSEERIIEITRELMLTYITSEEMAAASAADKEASSAPAKTLAPAFASSSSSSSARHNDDAVTDIPF